MLKYSYCYPTLTFFILVAIYGYSVDTSPITSPKETNQALSDSRLTRNDGEGGNITQLEKETEAKDKEKRPGMSAERRSAYNSIRDRRAYFKRKEDAVRQRRPPSRRVDPDRDVLEPQETVHRPLHTIPKQSVISVDKNYYEFGVKLPKRISTKLSLVDGWGTTALPGDMDNLVMPPSAKYAPKMSRLVSTSTGRPASHFGPKMARLVTPPSDQPAIPLPLSLPDKNYPTRIEINENNKRILSEMLTTTHAYMPEGLNHTILISTPLNVVTHSSSTMRPSSTPTTTITTTTTIPPNNLTASASVSVVNVITAPDEHVEDQATASTTQTDATTLSSSIDNAPTTAKHRESTITTQSNNSTQSNIPTLPQQTPSLNESETSTAFSKSTTEESIATTPKFHIVINQPKIDENVGRAFPTGFNDFRREEQSEDDIHIELNKIQPTISNIINNTEEFHLELNTPSDDQNANETSVPSVATSKTQSVGVPDDATITEPDLFVSSSVPPTTTTNSHSSPPYIKVYVTSPPTEDSPYNIFYGASAPSNGSDTGIVVSIVDEGTVSSQSVGLAVYLLAIFGLVPLILAFVFVVKYFLNRHSRKSDCDSDASSTDAQPPSSRPRGSELRKSPSSATTITLVHATRLPRVQQKCPSWELPRHHLTLLSILGHGNFGQVWKAELQEGLGSNTRLVAVKTVKEGATEKEQEELIKELQVMQHVGHHPNVVQLLGCCTDKEPYYLVMEYISNGKLLTFLREHRTQGNYYNFSNDSEALTSRDLTVFMYCVARGMEYLVSKRIIHRDLAARNVLVDQHKMCKIADFGMSRLTQEGNDGEIYEERQHRGALPIRWMAPESLHYSIFTHKTDVWSFGIVMWEIVTLGSTPYPSLGAREVVQGVRNGLRLQRPSHVKTDLFRLVSKCWSQDPQSRPSFTELRLHLADLLDGSCVDLDSFALDNSFQLQTRTRNRRSKNTGKGTVTLVGNGSFTVNSRILENQFSIV